MTDTSKRLGGHAVVVGGGMGGMMAAEVASRFFDAVTILDKDVMPTDVQPRLGAPQGAHAHALLVQGRRNLERLFPGFTSELLDRGAVASIAGLEFKLNDGIGWMPERDLGLTLMSMSRPLLEGTVRDFLARNAKVSTRQDIKVEGWVFEAGKVVGVKASSDVGDETIAADLVIDASGRSSDSKAWLEAGGFGPVPETVIEIGAGYASAIFEKPAGWSNPYKGVGISAPLPDTRGGIIFSIEHNRFICSLIGRFGQVPTGDEAAFFAMAKSLDEPDLFDWISAGKRVTPIKVYRAPTSRWRRYEQLEQFPEGLLPIGDAVAHVNPLRGQGMTLASEQVRILWEVLSERASTGRDSPLAKPYFERIHDFTGSVWAGLEAMEYTFAEVKGDRPADLPQRWEFGKALRQLVETDSEAHRVINQIGQLTLPPSAMATSGVRDRVIALMQAQAPEAVEA